MKHLFCAGCYAWHFKSMYDFTEGLQKDQDIGVINLVLQTWKRRQEVGMADTGGG